MRAPQEDKFLRVGLFRRYCESQCHAKACASRAMRPTLLRAHLVCRQGRTVTRPDDFASSRAARNASIPDQANVLAAATHPKSRCCCLQGYWQHPGVGIVEINPASPRF
jgi:hypothetical protein